MIFTNTKHAERYLGIDPVLDKAIQYLLNTDILALENGIHEVDGKTLYVNRHEYDTLPLEQAKWEAHRDYLDIQVVLAGEEKIGVTDMDKLNCLSYSEERDRYELTGEVDNWIAMQPGDLLFLYPEDAHMVKVQTNGAVHVQKACIKVKI